jgi:hypothetical protein
MNLTDLTWHKEDSIPRLDMVMSNLSHNIEFWKSMKLTEEEANKAVFPRDLPPRYLQQAQRQTQVASTVQLGGDQKPEDELTKEIQRQKIAFHSNKAQSWMDDISSLSSPKGSNSEQDSLAAEFERQRLGGKPREAREAMRERSSKKGEKFLDKYGMLIIPFTPSGRYFYSNDMVRKLCLAITLGLTQSSSEHAGKLQIDLVLVIACAWLVYTLADMRVCRIWACRAELIAAGSFVVILALLLVYTYASDNHQMNETSLYSKLLILIAGCSLVLQIVTLFAESTSKCCSNNSGLQSFQRAASSATSASSSSSQHTEEVSIDLSVVYPKSSASELSTQASTKQASSDTTLVRRLSLDGKKAVKVDVTPSESDNVVEDMISGNLPPLGSRL